MKRSELKNYIRETILNKLDEAEPGGVTVDDDTPDDDIKKLSDKGVPVTKMDLGESDKKKG